MWLYIKPDVETTAYHVKILNFEVNEWDILALPHKDECICLWKGQLNIC